MKRFLFLGVLAVLCAGAASGQDAPKAAAPESVTPAQETRYLAFQIFTSRPDPKIPPSGDANEPVGLPDKAALRSYIDDIKQRIGTVGGQHTKLAFVLGPLSFEQTDAQVTGFIAQAFELAIETDVAVGFHIDDSIFWGRRKDLLSDPKNIEAMDWEGTSCTGRRMDWSRTPTCAAPQMCFNSPAILREVQQRATLIGKAIRSGMDQLQQRHKAELFAGAIAGWETMIGRDFKSGKYLGYRAMMNRGFSREHPPQDLDAEREKVVQDFIELWATGIAQAGVPPQQIYSHTAFFPQRVFKLGDEKDITYSQRNHFAPPPVAFGKNHRPGFSTYPQPGLFDELHAELAKHQQQGWASSEGTNLQIGSAPGKSGMTMETYLAKVFNHGGTLVNIFSWGMGGEAFKKMDFRVVTEGEEALAAYRKFLKGEPLIEATGEASTVMERLPAKVHKIQQALPGWIHNADDRDEATAMMKQLDGQLKAHNLDEAEKTADAILKMISAGE